MSRHYSRRGNGRFRQSTLENTFGLKAWACAACHRFNPRSVYEPKPEVCEHCGAKPFRDLLDPADREPAAPDAGKKSDTEF